MPVKLTPYGRREVGAAAVITTAACGALVWLAAAAGWAWLALLAVPLAVWGGIAWFFRDPDRPIPDGPGLFVSPADGRVTDITRVGPDSALGRDGVRVGIFMSLFDVHVNRSPCDGRVERIEHRDGAFLDARDPAAAEKNESTTISLTTTHDGAEYPLVVRQVAGLIARRIVTDVEEGGRVARGARIGMVKFGSRLEVLVPGGLAGRVCVERGQKVLAGQTVLISAPAGTADDPDAQRR